MKHWVFDLDGTLVDSAGKFHEKLKRVLQHFGLQPTTADLEKSRNYFDVREYFALYLKSGEIEPAVNYLLQLSHEMAGYSHKYEGIENILQHLKDDGRSLSLWTGRDLRSCSRILELTELQKYFDVVVSATCITKTKPDTEGLLKALNDAGFEAHESVMVGDHEYDIQPAKALGLQALSVSWGSDDPFNLRSVSDRHFSDTSEMLTWLRKIQKPDA